MSNTVSPARKEEKTYGVYIHIPFCRSKCKYCSFVSTPDLSLRRAYVDALIREIETSESIGSHVDTVYFGGGTPSCLARGELSRIYNALSRSFSISDNAEITVECNPESVDREFVGECESLGVDRISMGMQSADNNVLRAAGRAHTRERYFEALETLRAAFDNISTDIILGLPLQNMRDIENAVRATNGVKHVSVYALSVERGTAFYDDNYSVDDDVVAEMYDCARAMLSERGFRRYEVSNFAADGYESRHNKKYWQCEPYVGFGAAAHGYDGEYVRYAHGDDIAAYIADQRAEKIVLTETDRYNEYIMLALRTERGLDRRKFFDIFGYDFCVKNAKYVEKYVNIGAVELGDEFVRISSEKMFVMNGIIEDFMTE